MGQLQQADDLDQVAAEARAKRIPVLIAFMQQSCPYCAIARKNHLLPIQADPQWGKRVLIREVDVDRNTALRDFAGAPHHTSRLRPTSSGAKSADADRL